MRIYPVIFLALCVGSQASFSNVLVGVSDHRTNMAFPKSPSAKAHMVLLAGSMLYKLPMPSLLSGLVSSWSGTGTKTSDTTAAASPSGQQTSASTVNSLTPSNSAKTCGLGIGGDGEPPRDPTRYVDDSKQDIGKLGLEENPYIAKARAYAQAAAGGDAMALVRLGRLCSQGHLNGTPYIKPNGNQFTAAAEYYSQASRIREGAGLGDLGALCAGGHLSRTPYIRPNENQFTAAARLMTQAASAGSTMATFGLGLLCEQGHLSRTPYIKPNENRFTAAARYLSLPASVGYAARRMILGSLCQRGHLNGTPYVEPDKNQFRAAARHYFQAYERGMTRAIFHLGELCEQGHLSGVPYDAVINILRSFGQDSKDFEKAQNLLRRISMVVTVMEPT